jgi:hypothetical protein
MIATKLFYRTTYGDHEANCQGFRQSHFIPCDPTVTTFVNSTPIVAQIEADESTHRALESNAAFHTMSLLVSGSTMCPACVIALSAYGITSTDNMWTAGKKLSAVHPELKPTRF